MKTRRAILLSFIVLAATSAFAAKPAAPSKPAKKPEGPMMPSTKLRQLIDQTLPRIQTIAGPNKVQDRTKLAMEQANFIASAQLAAPANQPMYQAAAGVIAT